MWRPQIAAGLCLALLSNFAAGEPDAAIAHPLRWSDPDGTPAGTRRSACLPLTDDVEEKWSLMLPGKALSAIVYWERIAYLICAGKKETHYLVAIDVIEGKLLSKKRLPKGPVPMPVVWDGRIYLTQGGIELAEYSRAGKSFNRVYVHKPAHEWLSHPIVFENEIYVVADGDLMRLRPRRKSPVWRTSYGTLRGRPALYGKHVYAMGDYVDGRSYPSMHLFVFERNGGRKTLMINGAWYESKDPPPLRLPGTLTITDTQVIMGGPTPLKTQSGPCSHAFLDRSDGDGRNGGRLRIGTEPVRLQNYPVPPAMTPLGNLVLVSAKPLGWVLRTPKGGHYISTVEDNRDLYDIRKRVAPTVLGDIVYFGAWAADIRTYRILWRLPVERLRFPAVPIDSGVLVIDNDSRLRAFGPRTRGQGMGRGK